MKPIGESATFHDPCQIVRRGGLEAAARRVLAALGFELVELRGPRPHRLLLRRWRRRRLEPARRATARQGVRDQAEQVDATGAEHCVTSCGQCRITLEMGARNAQVGQDECESLLELVADHLVEEDAMTP